MNQKAKEELVIGLPDPAAANAQLVGNKAAGLVELQSAGFSVPSGFCVTTTAFENCSESGRVSQELRQLILKAYEDLKKPVAVRSSSPAEDTAGASFAGQYVTVLGVYESSDLVAAIEQCWASGTSAQANAYQQDRHVDQKAPMGVLVQELVQATSAGVVFTMHPVTLRTDQIVVNSNFGIGELVVSGNVEPDSFLLNKANGSVLESSIGSKARIVGIGSNGYEERELEEKRRSQQSLTSNQLLTIASAAKRLEHHFDFPMDAEFAFVNDSLYMLQARPVTIGAEAYFTDLLDEWARERGLEIDPEALWARGSPISGLPVSPLYYSEMAAFFSDMFPEVAKIRGTAAGKRKSFRYYRGYTYTDVTFTSTADPAGIKPLGLFSRTWLTNVWLGVKHPRTYAFWCSIDAYFKYWETKWLPALNSARPNYTAASPEEIIDYIELVERQRRERSIFSALGVGYANDYLGLLTHLIQRWAPGLPEETIGTLTGGSDDSLTHAENVAVWELAELAGDQPEIRELLISQRFEELKQNNAGREFLKRIEAFRDERPHRGCSDRDLYQRRWGDDISLLLNHIGTLLQLDTSASPQKAHAKAAQRRQEAEHRLFERAGRGVFGLVKVAVLRNVVKQAQRYWMQRDNQRHSFDRYFWELRCAYRALGHHLQKQAVIHNSDDIFFLAKTEIYDFFGGRLSEQVLDHRANWRRDWWMQVKSQQPPPMLKGNIPQDPADDESSADLVGVGGSPGKVIGPTRLVVSLDQLRNVGKGEILVTHAIDPAWTPVFGFIGGVISEEGGMLSHATILGREYGLPVVIGVAGATTRLNDGDVVEINGTSGAVRVIESEQNE